MPISSLDHDILSLPDACGIGGSVPFVLYQVVLRGPNSVAKNAAIGILNIAQYHVNNTPFVITHHVDFTPPYSSLPLALNIVLTVAIVLRLSAFRCQVVPTLGR